MLRKNRLRDFVQGFTGLLEACAGEEKRVFGAGRALLSELIAQDDWLPERFAAPHPERYRQYLLYCDPRERFSVVSFVWGPGQITPIHDHTVWGMVGMLRGRELCEEFGLDAESGRLTAGHVHTLEPGGIDLVSPRVGDVHRVANALADRLSISIHVYGANIGAVQRHVFAASDGRPAPFVSGYSDDVLPNIWGDAAEAAPVPE